MEQSDIESFSVSGFGHGAINYRIFVSKPDDTIPAPEPTRIIYSLDGNWLFPIVAAYVKTLRLFEPGFENTVVVGIGYDTHDDRLINQLRVLDLAPQQTDSETVPRFRDFVTAELPALLRERHAISEGRRILIGHSWGGAFTLFTLLTAPSAFDGYLSVSPPVGSSVLPSIEESFYRTGQALDSQMLVCVGGEEANFLPDVLEFSRLLERRGYKGFSFASHVFHDENHSSVIMPAIARGLRALF